MLDDGALDYDGLIFFNFFFVSFDFFILLPKCFFLYLWIRGLKTISFTGIKCNLPMDNMIHVIGMVVISWCHLNSRFIILFYICSCTEI